MLCKRNGLEFNSRVDDDDNWNCKYRRKIVCKERTIERGEGRKDKTPRIRRNDGTTGPECMFRGIKKKTKKQIRSDHRTDQAQEMTRPGNERNLIQAHQNYFVTFFGRFYYRHTKTFLYFLEDSRLNRHDTKDCNFRHDGVESQL